MRWFRWNSFTVIGLILLGVGVYSLIKGAAFQFDSGLPAEQFEPWFYLLVGTLMVLNGVVQPRFVVSDEVATTSVPETSVGNPVAANAAGVVEPAQAAAQQPVGTKLP